MRIWFESTRNNIICWFIRKKNNATFVFSTCRNFWLSIFSSRNRDIIVILLNKLFINYYCCRNSSCYYTSNYTTSTYCFVIFWCYLKIIIVSYRRNIIIYSIYYQVLSNDPKIENLFYQHHIDNDFHTYLSKYYQSYLISDVQFL